MNGVSEGNGSSTERNGTKVETFFRAAIQSMMSKTVPDILADLFLYGSSTTQATAKTISRGMNVSSHGTILLPKRVTIPFTAENIIQIRKMTPATGLYSPLICQCRPCSFHEMCVWLFLVSVAILCWGVYWFSGSSEMDTTSAELLGQENKHENYNWYMMVTK